MQRNGIDGMDHAVVAVDEDLVVLPVIVVVLPVTIDEMVVPEVMVLAAAVVAVMDETKEAAVDEAGMTTGAETAVTMTEEADTEVVMTGDADTAVKGEEGLVVGMGTTVGTDDRLHRQRTSVRCHWKTRTDRS